MNMTGFGMVPNMPGRLTPYEIAVYVVLTWRTSFETGACFPSHASIAEDACMSEKSVRRALQGLREKGLVTWEQRRDEAGDLTSNVYRVQTVRAAGGSGLTDPTPGPTDPTVRSQGPDGPVSQTEGTRPNEQEELNKTSLALVEGSDVAEARRLCEYLSQRLGDDLDVPASRRVVTPTWVTEMRRMIQRDMRTPESIEAAINWAMSDDFWRGNIQSPTSLRKHYDKMRLQAQRRPQGRNTAAAEIAQQTGASLRDVEQAMQADATRLIREMRESRDRREAR